VQKNQEEVREVTKLLFEKQIPKFARTLEERMSKLLATSLPSSGVEKAKFFNQFLGPRQLHDEGINVRHLGRIRSLVREGTEPQKGLRNLILSICVGRVCKNMIREKMRDMMMEVTVPCEEPFKEIIVDHVNMILANNTKNNNVTKNNSIDKRSYYFWHVDVKEALRRTFHSVLTEEEEQSDFDLHCRVDLGVVLQYLLPQVGDLLPGIQEELHQDVEHFTCTTSDLASLHCETREWHMVHFARAMTLKQQAQAAKLGGFEREYKRLAIRALYACFEAHNAAPFCPVITFNFAQSVAEAVEFLPCAAEKGEMLVHVQHLYETEVLRFTMFWTNPKALLWIYAQLLRGRARHLRCFTTTTGDNNENNSIGEEQALELEREAEKQEALATEEERRKLPLFSCEKYKAAMFVESNDDTVKLGRRPNTTAVRGGRCVTGGEQATTGGEEEEKEEVVEVCIIRKKLN
jgi:hypothetical protein